MTTLVQGMKDYLAHPIIDKQLINGILDTLAA